MDEGREYIPVLRLSKKAKLRGIIKGSQPLDYKSGSGGVYVGTEKTFRFSYFAGFAARERMREAKPVSIRKSDL